MVDILVNDEDMMIFSCPSYSHPGEEHIVSWDDILGWWCSCEHYMFRKKFCKHMSECYALAVEEGRFLDKEVFEYGD